MIKNLNQIKDEFLFWGLHCALDLGSTKISLKGIEVCGQYLSQIKARRDHYLFKLIYSLKYAHSLDLVDLKNRIQALEISNQEIRNDLDDLITSLDLKGTLKES